MKDAIRFADATRHSGVILEAFSQAELNGEPIAGIGHKAGCPRLNTIPCRRWIASEARQRANQYGTGECSASQRAPPQTRSAFALLRSLICA
ncbi:PAAR domain-containing protein [Pseudomonas protegens]|uniref:PAAR domain-containing protein n=1 Tax=Pseudomonas protegens TaxID=380021 RepID=UPI0011B421DA|nr:PAAR domain-containing protein [Pseudomonas protegens]